MASGSESESQNLIFIDKFEEFDIIEFDEAILRELLEKPEEESKGGGDGCLNELTKVIESNVMIDDSDCSEHVVEANFDWYDDDMVAMMMEMAPSLPSDEIIPWCVDECMEEMGYFDVDEIVYTGLWQD